MQHVHNRLAVDGWDNARDSVGSDQYSCHGSRRTSAARGTAGIRGYYEGFAHAIRRRTERLEAIWKSSMKASGPGAWTDAYWMAFAKVHGLHVVTFHKDSSVSGMRVRLSWRASG